MCPKLQQLMTNTAAATVDYSQTVLG